MSINIYMRETKLHDVLGRVAYVTAPERQKEKLIAVAGQTDIAFWRRLSMDCQSSFKPRTHVVQNKDGSMEIKADVCCEARELITAMPNSLLGLTMEQLQEKLKALSDFIRLCTGTENVIGLHDSRAGTAEEANAHVHIIFAERVMLQQPEIKFAERNLFYDAAGRRCYTKKEIIGEDGKLREGCKIVQKGTILGERYFSEKLAYTKDPAWLHAMKQDVADWINQECQPDKLREVFDPHGPFLAQRHVDKGSPPEDAREIRKWNYNVKFYNNMVKMGKVTPEEALHNKTRITLSPNANEELEIIIGDIGTSIAKLERNFTFFEKQASRTEMTKREDQGPTEELKQQLREAYRQSTLLRQQSRKAADPFEKAELGRKLRENSVIIEHLRGELGYVKDTDIRSREKSVWEAVQQVRLMERPGPERREKVMKKRAEAWEKLSEAYENKKRYLGFWWCDPESGEWIKVEGEYRERDPRRLKVLDALDRAREGYAAAKKEVRAFPDAKKLEYEYQTYALALAKDPEVPEEELARARQKYLAAARYLRDPTPSKVAEMKHQLKDLKRSQRIRNEKRQEMRQQQTQQRAEMQAER